MDNFEKDLKIGFLDEMETYLNDINQILSSNEWDQINDEHIKKFFRYIHSIKGNSKVAGHEELVHATHLFENILFKLRDGNITFTKEVKDIFVEFNDKLSDAVETLKHDLDAHVDLTVLEKNITSFLENYHAPDKPTDFTKKIIKNQVSQENKTAQLIDIFKMKILVIDDDPDFTSFVSTIITKTLNIDTIAKEDGVHALIACTKEKYSVIICDYDMPGINGTNFIHTLRNNDGINKNTYIIFTSAYNPEDLPFHDWENVVYLQKPITKNKFLNYIRFGLNSLLV